MSGGKKDAIGDLNKPRLSLIPKRALWALGGALTYGEVHYGSHNWRKGISISYLIDAALRHINEFNDGENIDVKSQNHHLGNAMANLAMAIELSETNVAMDDRYKPILDSFIEENKELVSEPVVEETKVVHNKREYLLPKDSKIVHTHGGYVYVGPEGVMPLEKAEALNIVIGYNSDMVR
jgi:hypothetical protein